MGSYRDISNVEFFQPIHILSLWYHSLINLILLVYFFLHLSLHKLASLWYWIPPTLIGSKVDEDMQGFIDVMEKIFGVMLATNVKGVEFVSYKLKI